MPRCHTRDALHDVLHDVHTVQHAPVCSTPPVPCLQVVTTLEQKKQLCAASVAWNAKDPTFKKLFPELVDGTLFEDPSKPVAPPATPAAAPAPKPAPAPPPPEVVEAVEEEEEEDEAAPGEGKNAAKNKKKREKERAKRLAAAGQDGAEAAEVDGAAAALAAAAISNK